MNLKHTTIGEVLRKTASKFPQKLALKYVDTPPISYEIDYYSLDRQVDKWAKGMMARGIQKGDVVAAWSTNYPQEVIIMFATVRIGAVFMPINSNFKRDGVEDLLKRSEAKMLFICNGLLNIDAHKIMDKICPEIATCERGKLKSEVLPMLEMIVSMDDKYDDMHKKFYHWDDIPAFGIEVSEEDYEKRQNEVKPKDVAFMMPTSGTTGVPKLSLLSHFSEVNNAIWTGILLEQTSEDRVCIPVPTYHCFGTSLSILTCVTYGSSMYTMLFFTPLRVLNHLEYNKITILHGAPVMFKRVLEHLDRGDYTFEALRTGIMAGSNCTPELLRKADEKLGMRIISIYGKTETSPGCTGSKVTDPEEIRYNTVGTMFEHVEGRVVDFKTGEAIIGIEGEFQCKGYNIMIEYYNDTEANQKAFTEDGWLKSGDTAIENEDGTFTIIGRMDDMIIRGSENIYPAEIENPLEKHPFVETVAAFGFPSEEYGQEVAAFVVLKKGSIAKEKELKDFLTKKIEFTKIPTYIFIVGDEDIPLNGAGKLERNKLLGIAKTKPGFVCT